MEGHIQLKRMVMEWQWYKEPKTAFLFIHLLLTANHTIGKWKGVTILRGQLVTSLNHLSSNTGLSIKNIRTAFQHLEKTRDIIRKPANQYTLITICTYDEYIDRIVKGGKQVAHHRHTNDKQVATNNNDDNVETENINNPHGPLKGSVNIPFDVFWNLYKRKVGDKKSCEKKWNSLNDSVRQKIIDTLPKFFEPIRDEKFIPYPQTYLNQGRWNDVIEIKQPVRMMP